MKSFETLIFESNKSFQSFNSTTIHDITNEDPTWGTQAYTRKRRKDSIWWQFITSFPSSSLLCAKSLLGRRRAEQEGKTLPEFNHYDINKIRGPGEGKPPPALTFLRLILSISFRFGCFCSAPFMRNSPTTLVFRNTKINSMWFVNVSRGMFCCEKVKNEQLLCC